MSLRSRIIDYCIIQRWTLGFTEQPLKDIIEGAPLDVHYIKHNYYDRWFADPFILDYDEENIFVLVEEFLDKTKLGRISKLRIDRKSYSLLDITPILELDTHLSFPAIMRKEGIIYIYPENATGRGLALYEYNDKTESCKLVKDISKEPLADAIITDVLDKTLMFTTQIPNHNGNELYIYQFKDAKPELISKARFPSNVARNAGDWFRSSDKVYRPAQDCDNDVYGSAVVIQEVDCNDGNFCFRDIRRIESTNKNFTTGCHTFNHYNGLTVIDVHGYRHYTAAKTFKKMFRLYKHYFK